MKNLLKLCVLALIFMFSSCVKDDLETIVEDENSKVVPTSLSSKLNTVIQAEDYDGQSGVQPSGGGWKVGYINNGDWIRFDDFDHSGATSITVTAASSTNGGTIEFRKGSATGGNLLAEVNVSGTGGWSNMQEFTANITGSSSNSDLYVVFKGGSGYLLDVDSFEFKSSGTTNPGTGENLALSGSAEQSSTSYNGAASRAIDGNTSGVWNQGSVTHTANEYQPWWQVRLANDTNIEEIVIWNRTNCCSSRLSNFDVFVYNQAGVLQYKETIVDTPNPSVTINTGGVTGNRVRVKLKGTNPLSLAEVQVFGESNDDPNPPNPPTGGDYPYDVLGLDDWKITLPRSNDGDSIADEVYVTQSKNDDSSDPSLTEYSDEFFYVSDNGVIFECPADQSLPRTSAGTSNTRTELREMPNNDNEAGWSASGSTVRELEFSARVLQTSSTSKVAFAQIHDYQQSNWDDLIRVQIESDDPNATVGDYGKIYIMGDMAEGLSSEGVPTQPSSERTIIENYRLGDWMNIRITYNNNTIRIYVDGNEVQEYTGADCASNYFKAGAYNQSMNSSSSGKSVVEFRSLSVTENF